MNRYALVCLALALPALVVHAEAVDYSIDPAHTTVGWEVRHFGSSTYSGRFDKVEGSITLDREAGSGAVSISIATTSLVSDFPAFDAVLRGGNFLAAQAHPIATFVSRSLHLDAGQLRDLRGEFSLRGVSHPLTLQATHFSCWADDDATVAREACGGDFEAEIRRSDYGSTFALPFVGDTVRLLIRVRAVRRTDAPGRPPQAACCTAV